jgi:glycosyltransferase involved in cell wall biosynthesis
MTVRVLEIIPTLVRGGAEKQLTLLASGLPTDEFSVQVAVLSQDGPYREVLEQRGIPMTLIRKKWKLDPLAYWRLKRVIRDVQPDIVHTWIFAANCYGRQAAFAAGVPHVVAGERCVDQWKVWHELAIDRRLARRTDRIAVNSSGVRDFYVRHGIPPEKFVLIPNGIAPFAPTVSITRSQLLQELRLPSTARLLGAVGRLWPQKRYKDLIWAAELLRAGRGDTHLLIVGDGPQRDALQRYCRQIQVVGHVHFLGERRDVAALYPHFECFWLGSGYEGQSNALMEAMSAGVPVVATDIPGNRDLVVPDQTGFLVPVGDSGELARKTHLILNDPELARSLGVRGKARMQREFSIEKMVERYAALYRTLVAS